MDVTAVAVNGYGGFVFAPQKWVTCLSRFGDLIFPGGEGADVATVLFIMSGMAILVCRQF